MKTQHDAGYSLLINTLELEGEVCESFGIRFCRGGRELLSIPDISPDEGRVRYMIDLFNDGSLAEEHVFDVIEDMLP